MIQKLLLFLCGVALFTLITAGKNDGSNILKSSGSHISSTGAPGEQTCAQAGCHADASIEHDDNKAVTLLTLGNGEKSYTPSTKYTVRLHAAKLGVGRFGFQIVALDTTNRSIGTFAVPQGSNRVQLQKGAINSSDRYYVTHTTAGNKPILNEEIDWLFNWTAPPKYKGKVTFYYCVNATNMDNASTGDHLYLASESYSATTTNIEEQEQVSNNFSIYPTIANEYLTVENKSGFEKNTSYSIVSIGGMPLLNNQVENGSTASSIPLSSLPNGFYSLVISTGETTFVKKFVVMR